MARKFQTGDTVQVVKNTKPSSWPYEKDFKLGHRGVVRKYQASNKEFPYSVKRKNDNIQSFNARELKLIKKK